MRATIQQDGSLKIQVGEPETFGVDEREEITAAGSYYDRQAFVMGSLGDEWEWVSPADLGALTESPIIARSEDLIRDAYTGEIEGMQNSAAGVWWYPDCQIRDPWEVLARDGEVVFVNGMDRFVQEG